MNIHVIDLIPLTSPPFGQIRNHNEENLNNHLDCNINTEEFTILIFAESNYDLIIKEES